VEDFSDVRSEKTREHSPYVPPGYNDGRLEVILRTSGDCPYLPHLHEGKNSSPHLNFRDRLGRFNQPTSQWPWLFVPVNLRSARSGGSRLLARACFSLSAARATDPASLLFESAPSTDG
jgi:hypothetical protein